MSRARIGHEFCPMPRRWYSGWADHQSFHARGLRDALFELADGSPIPVHGSDWLASICNQLCVHGKDRPNVRKTLKLFVDSGLISFDGAHVHGRYLIDASPIPNRAQTEPKRSLDSAHSVQIAPIPLESTPRNDSTRISQTDRQTEERDETERGRASGREDLIGFNFVASLLGRSTFDIPPLGAALRQYTWIGGRPEAERAAVKLAVDADPWCLANKHCIDAKHLEARWQRYLHGAPKTVARTFVVAKEALAEARENTIAAAKYVNAVEGKPVIERVDRDGNPRKSWVDQLADAKQRLKAAREAEQALRVQLQEAS